MPISKILLALVVPVAAYGYEYGPDPRKTGAPGDAPMSCVAAGCHSGPLNRPGGSVQIVLPNGNTYMPGVKQHIVVKITDPVQKRWGFEMTARLASDLANGQAGDFNPTDNNTQVICNDSGVKPCRASQNIQFIEHTFGGTRRGVMGGITFEFDWTPPPTNAGDVMFYVAANAANGDASPSGDHIYTSQARLAGPCPTGGPKPAVTSGVMNGASFQPGISPNSWITITGTNLASTTRSWSDGDFAGGNLPTQLSCTSVMVNNKPAFVEYISPTQINAIAPDDGSSGPVQVTVTAAGQSSDAASAQLQPLAPAFFLFDGKYLAATHVNGSLLGKAGLFPGAPNATTPANPGEVVIFYGTGFGPTNPAIPPGQVTDQLAPLKTNPVITIGGAPANVSFAGLIPPYAELYQFNVQVPATAASGDQPVVAQAGGILSPSGPSCCFITVK
ncbi:MAG: IPT/TIG domain-containing protein [Acidobacteriota bacterium]|nr:IPT/TIG domain-containing protein [Acidobacteriota bacterium]